MTHHIFIIAGEPSGDRLGADLMQGLAKLYGPVEFTGIGGPLMQAQKLDPLFDYLDLAVMGAAEILPRLPLLLRRISQTVTAIRQQKPDLIITIDSPDFCLRVLKKLDLKGQIPTVHYVAPSVWAWRPGRAVKMARQVDHVLALLPFEPPYMRRAGMSCDFVSHPIAAEPVPTAQDIQQFRAQHGFSNAPLLALLPGSRVGEVQRHIGFMGDIAARLQPKFPDLQIILPTLPHLRKIIDESSQDWAITPHIFTSKSDDRAQKYHAMASADAALAVSGTISLELAALAVPSAIIYQMNPISAAIARKLVKLPSVTLPNLIAGENIMPEFLLEAMQPAPVSETISQFLLDEEGAATKQRAAFTQVMKKLGKGEPELIYRPARSVGQIMGWE